MSKNIKDVKTIKIVSKTKYQRLERNIKRLESQNADLKLLHKEMKKQDRNTKAFVYRYLKPKYRPHLVDSGENEAWSSDGRTYSTLHA